MEMQPQIPFRFVGQSDLRISASDQGINVNPKIGLAFRHDRFQSGVCVKEVNSSVALCVQHGIVRKFVTGGGISAQVKVLNRAVSHRTSSDVNLISRGRSLALSSAFLQAGFHPGHSFIEKVDEAYRVTAAGLEPFPVLALDCAKSNVIQAVAALVVNPSNLLRGSEHHREVIRLRKVSNVYDLGSLELVQPILDGSHVSGIIPVPPIALLDHQRDLEIRHEDTLGTTFLDAAHSSFSEFFNDGRYLVIVERLSTLLNGDVESFIHLFEFLSADVAQHLPDFFALFIARLELDHIQLTNLLKFWTFVKSTFGIFVELCEVGDIWNITVKIRVFLLEILNKHSELCAPVSDMVDTVDFRAHVFHNATHCLADDCGAEVANVHLLGDVRTGEVDDYVRWLFRCGRGSDAFRLSRRAILDDVINALFQVRSFDATHNEAWSIHLQIFQEWIIVPHRIND
mmetsp:Transcript_9998/g.18286  ORF Transcript_9998/g.18286 Transcript_9998/m.18286 type:complete len:456 (-) Transcript_9998:1067-2434(-)